MPLAPHAADRRAGEPRGRQGVPTSNGQGARADDASGRCSQQSQIQAAARSLCPRPGCCLCPFAACLKRLGGAPPPPPSPAALAPARRRLRPLRHLHQAPSSSLPSSDPGAHRLCLHAMRDLPRHRGVRGRRAHQVAAPLHISIGAGLPLQEGTQPEACGATHACNARHGACPAIGARLGGRKVHQVTAWKDAASCDESARASHSLPTSLCVSPTPAPRLASSSSSVCLRSMWHTPPPLTLPTCLLAPPHDSPETCKYFEDWLSQGDW